MNYDSAYLWEMGCDGEPSKVSLVVQHAVVRRKEVILTCVSEGRSEGEIGITESGYFTEGLVEWFHRELLVLCERKMDEGIGKSIDKTLVRLQKEIMHYARKKEKRSKLHYIGMVCLDDSFWLFQQGDCQCYLLNKRYNRKHMKQIGCDSEGNGKCLQGKIQKRLGLLFCTSGYGSLLKKEEMLEVLITEGSCSQERMQKRLWELWQENVRRGEKGAVGAAFLACF